MEDRLKIFEYELNHIKNPDIRRFTEECIGIIPDYFFKIPASSTSKYHSVTCCGEGGLLRHTKANVMIAIDLLTLPMFKFNERQKDMIITVLILHDMVKSGIPQQKYTVHDHPILAAEYIRQHEEICKLLPEEDLNTILKAIERHMGNFTTAKYSKIVLEEPKTGLEKFTFMCDYLGSRRYLEYKFEV